MGCVIRQGRRLEVETIYPPVPKGQRRRFEPRWVKLPRHWFTALKRSKSAYTYQLATLILWESFKDKHRMGEVTLSTEVTGMSRATKMRAAEELVELGLIRLKREGTKALKAVV